MTERRKLSLGNVSERASKADAVKAWNISPARAENLKLQAREMRRHPSEAQKALWEELRDKKCAAFTFNRQVVMGSSIVDFACKSRWIAVEITEEGDDPTVAKLSDRKLTDVGVRVLRFPASQVLEDVDSVTAPIKEELLKPFERPQIERA